jgi:hypothetical protein
MMRPKVVLETSDERERVISLSSELASKALDLGEAVIVIGGWMLLEEIQRDLPAWRGIVFTTRLAKNRRMLLQWTSDPAQALLCTPSMLLQTYEDIGSVDRPLTMILLEKRYRQKVARVLEILKRVRSEYTLADVPAEEQTVWDAEISDEPSTFRLLKDGVSPQWSWLF